MKSKRVTKFLACVLSVAMCAGPATVFASDVKTDASGSIEGDFDLASDSIKITVPAKASVRVNPLAETNPTGLSDCQVTSKELVITNKTVKKGTKADGSDNVGAKLLVTATGKITSKGTGVKTYYDYNAFTPNGASKEKNIYMQLNVASTTALSENNTFNLGTDSEPNIQSMTSVGSRVQFSVDAPTGTSISDNTNGVSDGDATYKAFAVMGQANTGAAWKAADVGLEIKYDVIISKATAVTSPSLNQSNDIQITSANGISVNDFIMDDQRYGAEVKNVLLYDKNMKTPEVLWPVDSEMLTWERNDNDDGYNFKVSKDDPSIKWLCEKKSGTTAGTYYLKVEFDDGRVSTEDITIQ